MRSVESSTGWLEQFDWISVWIQHLDLTAAGTSLHLVTKLDASFFQGFDLRRKVSHAKHDPIPSAWLLRLTTRHRA